MINLTDEQQTRLNQIVESGEKGKNTTSLKTMQEQHDALLSWVDLFRGEVKETRAHYVRDEIYRNFPIEVEEQLARAFRAIGEGNFKPSTEIAAALFSQVRYRNDQRYGIIRP
jgi:hypothetical protein